MNLQKLEIIAQLVCSIEFINRRFKSNCIYNLSNIHFRNKIADVKIIMYDDIDDLEINIYQSYLPVANIEDLTADEIYYILIKFLETYAISEETKILNYINHKMTLVNIVNAINEWEEDRCSDDEGVFNLNIEQDYKDFCGFYGEQTTERCKLLTTYWLGGRNFYSNIEDRKPGRNNKIIPLTYGTACSMFYRTIIDYLNTNFDNIFEVHRPIYEKCFVDINTYKKVRNSLIKWVAFSNDNSYEEESKIFSNWEECYNDMRINAIDKIKWNTEPRDIKELCGDDYIGYNMEFNRDFITHESYSGLYVYLIVPYDTKLDDIKNKVKKNDFKVYNNFMILNEN